MTINDTANGLAAMAEAMRKRAAELRDSFSEAMTEARRLDAAANALVGATFRPGRQRKVPSGTISSAVLACLESGPKRPCDIAKLINPPCVQTIYATLVRYREAGRVIKSEHGVYSLPPTQGAV